MSPGEGRDSPTGNRQGSTESRARRTTGRTSTAAEAKHRLTGREGQIVEALLQGGTNKELAARWGVSDQTIKNQLTTLYRKLGVSGRLELVPFAADFSIQV